MYRFRFLRPFLLLHLFPVQEMADIEVAIAGPRLDLLALDEALSRLAQQDQRRAELVKLRFFAGLTIAEAAQVLGVSESAADHD